MRDLLEWRREHGTIKGFPGAEEELPPEAILAMECDVLIPAAVENVIHGETAPLGEREAGRRGGERPPRPRKATASSGNAASR